MPKQGDAREAALRANGTFHARANEVDDALFRENGFFDPRDLVQVKYEMLRRVRERELSATSAAAAFGFSRVSYYQALHAFEREGIAGLLPRPRGPRHAHKLTGEVMAFVRASLLERPRARPEDLVEAVYREFGLRVHVRSLERALARSKKNG